MWRIYNVVQLQPRLIRNLGSNNSSNSPLPLIIDPNKSCSKRKNESIVSQQEISNQNLAKRVSKQQSMNYGDSNKLINRLKKFLLNQFNNCNDSFQESKHFCEVQEMQDRSKISKFSKDQISKYDSLNCGKHQRLEEPQFIDNSSKKIWRDQPPSKKLEEILNSLREWENKIGWNATNNVCERTLADKKNELDKISRYALEMQRNNNIRNQRRNLSVEMKSGLEDIRKKASNIKQCPYPLEGDQIRKPLKSRNQAFSNSQKLESMKESNNLNDSADNQHSDFKRSCAQVKEIDSIIKDCKSLKKSCSLRKLQRKNNREIQCAVKKRYMDENNKFKATTNKVCVNTNPQLKISVLKLKNLSKSKAASAESFGDEIKKKLFELTKRSDLQNKDSDNFKRSRKNLSLTEIKHAISKSKSTFKEISKIKNSGTQIRSKEDKFLRNCQDERNRKNITLESCKQVSCKQYKGDKKSVSELENNQDLETELNKFNMVDNKNMNIYKTDDGTSRYISTAWPPSVLHKIFESDALMQIFKDSFERRESSKFNFPNRWTLLEPEKANSEAQFNINRNIQTFNNLWIVQWMQKFAQTPLYLRTNSNILLHLPHFKGGYFIGNTQLSSKLLDLKEDQMYGYDESDS